MKRMAALLLSALLLCSLSPAALAAEAEEEPELVEIATAEDFIAFARRCESDVYSSGVTFALTADIDLGGTDFAPVPYFAGTFLGRGHTVLGLDVRSDGSRMGLFRQIAEGAAVQDLTVKGRVAPGGTGIGVGGIAGVNAGTIENCRFEGTVSAPENVGGIAGEVTETGRVLACAFSGDVTGEHQAGGVAGVSRGVIGQCENAGSVNTVSITPQGQSGFDISAFSQDDFLDLANIGGIAGENLGVIAECVNTGAVGYKNTGYNVGGIAGKTSGLLHRCVNRGAVQGRRDVGGVAGQLIPYAAWDFSNGRMDALTAQLGSLQYLVNTLNRDGGSLSSELSGHLASMSGYTQTALTQLGHVMRQYAENDNLLIDRISRDPVTGDISVRDIDLTGIDTSGLTSALNNIVAESSALSGSIGDSIAAVTGDISRVSSQLSRVLGAMYEIIDSLSDAALFTTRDLSDAETDGHDMGAVAECVSYGSVSAENNAGGIVGAVGFEVSFDMEDRLNVSDLVTTQAEQSLFAAVRYCDAYGQVEAKADRAGGVVGSMDVGAVAGCTAAVSVAARGGDCAGGVAGWAAGTIKDCWARSVVRAEKYAGGVAGLGGDIRGCRVWTHVDYAREYAGAVAGWAEVEVKDNLFAASSPAGVDGVSLTGQTDPVGAEELLAMDGAPESFGELSVTFLVGDEVLQRRTIPFGGGIDELPAVENDGEKYWKWDDVDLSHIYYSLQVTGRYYAPGTTLSSGEDVPQFLVEGVFYQGQTLTAARTAAPFEDAELLGAYTLRVNDYDRELTVRMRLSEPGEVYLLGEDGEAERMESRMDGQYIVFTMPNGGSFACVRAQAAERPWLWPAAGGGAALLALLWALARRKKKTAASEEAAAGTKA